MREKTGSDLCLGRAMPSLVDRRTAGRIAHKVAVPCPRPLMLTRPTRTGPRAHLLGSWRSSPEVEDLLDAKVHPASETSETGRNCTHEVD